MSIQNRRVLVFGDSLSHRGATAASPIVEVRETSNRDGSPGDLLASKLLEAGASAARLDAKVSRSAYSFFKDEPAESMLAADRQWLGSNGVVLVMLGTNDAAKGHSTTANQTAFSRLKNAFPGQEIWAIGPPSFARADLTSKTPAVIAVEQGVFGANRFIDSRPLTADLTTPGVTRTASDGGVHFTASGAKAWAGRLAQTLVAKMDAAENRPVTVATTPAPAPPAQPDQPDQTPIQPLLIGFGVGAIVAVGLWLVHANRRPPGF